jgi:hypothetical protein
LSVQVETGQVATGVTVDYAVGVYHRDDYDAEGFSEWMIKYIRKEAYGLG